MGADGEKPSVSLWSIRLTGRLLFYVLTALVYVLQWAEYKVFARKNKKSKKMQKFLKNLKKGVDKWKTVW